MHKLSLTLWRCLMTMTLNDFNSFSSPTHLYCSSLTCCCHFLNRLVLQPSSVSLLDSQTVTRSNTLSTEKLPIIKMFLVVSDTLYFCKWGPFVSCLLFLADNWQQIKMLSHLRWKVLTTEMKVCEFQSTTMSRVTKRGQSTCGWLDLCGEGTIGGWKHMATADTPAISRFQLSRSVSLFKESFLGGKAWEDELH